MKVNIRTTFLKIIFLVISLFCVIPCHNVHGAKKKVRVAYFDLGSYYKAKKNNVIRSYDKAYLDMISQYTDCQFEYVNCGTWNQALRMLERHEIDLVGTMQWTREREDAYEICDANYGYTVAELAGLKDSKYIYEDYESINGATVGYMEGYVIEERLQDLMKEKKVSFRFKTYQSQKKLDQALEDGEIDLIAANAHAIHSDWKVIEKFAYAPFYFASWKGNEDLTKSISQAIIKINIHQSDFEGKIIKEYFPVMVDSPYNKNEMDVIGKKQTYHISFDGNTKPLVWYDTKNEKMQGVLVDLCEQLEEGTGLKFAIHKRDSDETKTSDYTVVYRTIYYGKEHNLSEKAGVTNSILDQKFEMYHKVGDKYKKGKAYRLAIVKNRDGLKDYLKEKYPACKLIEYQSPEECMEKLATDDVDLAFINSHIADDVMITHNYNHIISIPLTEETFGIALEFRGENAQILADIVDKGIQLVDTDKVNDSMLKYAVDTTPSMTVSYILQEHFYLFTFFCLVLTLIFIICMSLFIYARIMKKERNKMEEINHERTDFFARMSHDMRTPMNGIMGMLELTNQTSDLKEIRDNTDKAKQSGDYMLSLINDTLDLQRLENKKLALDEEWVYAKEFIAGIAEMIRPSAIQKEINFVVKNININENHYIKIDPMRLKQIFVNILSNAVKFTPEQGTIETTFEKIQASERTMKAKIMITDTGIGMSQEFIDRNLFHPYSQEHNTMTNRYAGSGLGLAIVKNLVDLMGGTIEVKSRQGEGTCFTIILSFEYMDEAVAKENLQVKHDSISEIKKVLENRHILICEDHPLNAEIATRLLEKMNCRITLAKDGLQGVKEFENSKIGEFDAILMDIRMPNMDGLEAARRIRGLDREDAKTIPMIAMTANAYDSDRERSREAGMNAHLAKPIEVNELYETLARWIKSA